ncbi:MAG TPA: SRPBCC domain-containing protein [Gemmatimonadaceae bacterium]
MSDILHDVWIQSKVEDVFRGIATPAGLDRWWTLKSSGTAKVDDTFELWFGPRYDWRAKVTTCQLNIEFELELTDAVPDWVGTRVHFLLEPKDGGTSLHFAHRGWAEVTDHYRVSNFCWAMYLRILRRYIEYGETVPYTDRLSA